MDEAIADLKARKVEDVPSLRAFVGAEKGRMSVVGTSIPMLTAWPLPIWRLKLPVPFERIASTTHDVRQSRCDRTG